MAKNKLKVIIDTNWYISAAINKKSRRILYDLLSNEKVIVLFNYKILEEFNLVIARDKFRKIITPSQTTRFINLMFPKLTNVEIHSEVSGSRDLKDNFLLSLAKDGKADFLITGDADLLVLKEMSSTKNVTLSEYLQLTSRKTQ